ncbi:MAG: 2-hydroxyacyl-CoA dehydratase [Bacillota bacterium]|nr:2-hydroxyacyl-CoA dehydratase [Bacillota bacterium]
MSKERKALFKKLRDEKYTILVPDMCPIHFNLLCEIISREGYKVKVVTPSGREAKDEGLRSIHNDACYPALIVCGQFVAELKSGNYDLNKTAVIMSQTGGGCRASNYISMFRKAFAKEFPTVPVLSLNFSGLEKDASFPMGWHFIKNAIVALQYGDMIMNLYYQTASYEERPGQAKEIADECLRKLREKIDTKDFNKMEKNMREIIADFSVIKIPEKRKPRVGIVGEIFVKYSSYANNNLADFLIKQGAEVVYPGLCEFLLYCIYNMIQDYKRYGKSPITAFAAKFVYRYFLKKCRKTDALLEGTQFYPFEDFEFIVKEGERIINTGVKMGEGWVIPAEMLAFADHGVKNVVCVQPFGCLPNHIVGKGMVRPLKQLNPELNVVPLDFDASSSEVNQENRLKLMLSNLN